MHTSFASFRITIVLTVALEVYLSSGLSALDSHLCITIIALQYQDVVKWLPCKPLDLISNLTGTVVEAITAAQIRLALDGMLKRSDCKNEKGLTVVPIQQPISWQAILCGFKAVDSENRRLHVAVKIYTNYTHLQLGDEPNKNGVRWQWGYSIARNQPGTALLSPHNEGQ